jgi:ferrous iron transport protein B
MTSAASSNTTSAASGAASGSQEILERAGQLRARLGTGFRDEVVQSLYAEAERVARRAVSSAGGGRWDLDQRIDRIVTSPVFGLPIMLLMLAAVFWLTIVGANVPSQLLASGLFWIEAQASALFSALGLPWWITGFLWHGVYRGLAWVVSVMLPPMAIFFPAFTILEDLGYLPRVAYNTWISCSKRPAPTASRP